MQSKSKGQGPTTDRFDTVLKYIHNKQNVNSIGTKKLIFSLKKKQKSYQTIIPFSFILVNKLILI